MIANHSLRMSGSLHWLPLALLWSPLLCDSPWAAESTLVESLGAGKALAKPIPASKAKARVTRRIVMIGGGAGN